jgi:hypothetical protein
MRTYDTETTAYFGARAGTVARQLVWIEARDRNTGATETIGLWSGEEKRQFVIDGEPRTYHGAGTLLKPDPVAASAGLAVRMYQVKLAAIAPEVEDLVLGYETRFAPVTVHRAFYDPATRALVGAPHRVFKGLINSITFPREKRGAAPACLLDLASETRALTRALGATKSDESQQARGGDRIRRFSDISGAVSVYWGEKRVST